MGPSTAMGIAAGICSGAYHATGRIDDALSLASEVIGDAQPGEFPRLWAVYLGRPSTSGYYRVNGQRKKALDVSRPFFGDWH